METIFSYESFSSYNLSEWVLNNFLIANLLDYNGSKKITILSMKRELGTIRTFKQQLIPFAVILCIRQKFLEIVAISESKIKGKKKNYWLLSGLK